MGKKGSWFSAIKRVFVFTSKEKSSADLEKKSLKEKKGRGILRTGESKSYIPLFREPSSIEKILCEADEQKLLLTAPTTSGQSRAPSLLAAWAASPRIATPRSSPPRASSSKVASPRVSSPRAISPRFVQRRKVLTYGYRTEPTLRNQHVAAIKIQALYRGYMARRNFKTLRGLVRLQGVMRGQSVKRQTSNAMKSMQLLVRVQTQIQLRRIQMLENQTLQHQSSKNDKDAESTLGKWTQLTETVPHEDWDDSLLTKEEMDVRLQKKVEAVIKRERAMAYAYSHQLWRTYPKSAQVALMEFRSNGHPWWWTWLERQITGPEASETPSIMKNVHLTPPRPASEYRPSPQKHNIRFNNKEMLTPRSSKSMAPSPMRVKQMLTPTRTPPANSSLLMKYSRASAADSPFDVPLRDDDSLTSCPPFSVPSYMTSTVSAKAKARASSNPKDGITGTPTNDSKRRFSFPLTPNIGPFRWNRGSNKDSTSQKTLEKHQNLHSMGDDVSVDSAISMPAVVGIGRRKPFNRFV